METVGNWNGSLCETKYVQAVCRPGYPSWWAPEAKQGRSGSMSQGEQNTTNRQNLRQFNCCPVHKQLRVVHMYTRVLRIAKDTVHLLLGSGAFVAVEDNSSGDGTTVATPAAASAAAVRVTGRLSRDLGCRIGRVQRNHTHAQTCVQQAVPRAQGWAA